jgi:antitoxin VapB
MTHSVEPKKEIRAKLFVNGRSQAVRLPKEFRFEGKEVRLLRVKEGILIQPISPVTKPWTTLDEFYARTAALREEHMFPEREEQPPAEERDPIL